MRKRLAFTIKTQMLLLIVSLTLVQFAAIAFTALNQQKHDLQDAILIAERLSNEVSNEQSVMLSGAEQLLSSLAYLPCIRHRDVQTTTALLAELVKKTPDVTNILIANSSGRVWASALPMKGVITADDRRFFKNVLATGTFSSGEYTIGRVLNKPALSFGYPIKDQSGNILDVAIIAFTLSKYNQLKNVSKLPESMSLVLTDHQGTILLDAGDPRFIGTKDSAAIFQRMVAGPDTGSFEAVGITGKERWFSYRKLRLDSEQTPYMYVRSGILKETVSRNIFNRLMMNAGIIMAVTLLVFACASYYIKRGLVDKIVALRDAAGKVAQGSLDIQIADHVSGGELGELGQAFDDMAHKLAEDSAARTAMEIALRTSEAKYRTLVETAIEGIWVEDKEHRATFVNRRMAEMLDYDPEEMIGRKGESFIVGEDTQVLNKEMQLRSQGISSQYEMRLRKKDGTTIWAMLSSAPLLDGDGNYNGAFAMVSDISDRKHAEQAQRQKEAADAANIAKSMFLSTVAHEFRTPLGRITTSIDILDRYGERLGKDKLSEQHEFIRGAAQQMSDLINSVISFNMMEMDRPETVPELLDISQFCRTVAREINTSWGAGHSFAIQIPDSCGAAMLPEPLLRRVLENLLTNAFRYTPEGGVVTMTVSRNCDLLHLEIRDSGIGIPEEDQHQVFEAFFRGRNVDLRRGLGLGLYIVHNSLTQLGGTISMTSTDGDGTTMQVTIPLIEA
jgi:PAS domain S-box-containing protein